VFSHKHNFNKGSRPLELFLLKLFTCAAFKLEVGSSIFFDELLIKSSAMRKNLLLTTALTLLALPSIFAQTGDDKQKPLLVPYVGVNVVGCFSNPASFTAGVQKMTKSHFNVAADIHYWNTNYECYCDDVYSKGHFRSVTPSVRLVFNSGKKMGNGFVATVGLGYMFAKDRGTEQPYIKDEINGGTILTGESLSGKWDFNSLAPSASFGVNVRILRLPVSFDYILYVAKASRGWEPAAGGIGIKAGFHRFEKSKKRK
jgi:hypothetical protein